MGDPQQAGTGKPAARPTPQGGDCRPHYRKRDVDAYMGELESQLRQRNKALHWILSNSHCEASRKAAAAALTEKP
jgi:hypothetical protein